MKKIKEILLYANWRNIFFSLLGSAILAAVGVGAFASVEEAAKMIELDKTFESQGVDYSECYERYLAYDSLLNK